MAKLFLFLMAFGSSASSRTADARHEDPITSVGYFLSSLEWLKLVATARALSSLITGELSRRLVVFPPVATLDASAQCPLALRWRAASAFDLTPGPYCP